MSDITEKLYKLIGDHPTGSKIQVTINVDEVMDLIHEILRLENDVYAYPPTQPYVPDGLTWKQLCAYKEQEKKGGEPIATYLSRLNATGEMLMGHHRQAIASMMDVLKAVPADDVETAWKKAMESFMTMPDKIMKGYK